jgi:hypothetical protein
MGEGEISEWQPGSVYRKIPMFASWGHKFRISCTTCRVIVTTAGPNQGGGGRGGETEAGGEGRRRAAARQTEPPT